MILDEADLRNAIKPINKGNQRFKLIKIPIKEQKQEVPDEGMENMTDILTSNKRRSTDVKNIPDEDTMIKRESSGRRSIRVWKGNVYNIIEIEKKYKNKEPIDEDKFDKDLLNLFTEYITKSNIY